MATFKSAVALCVLIVGALFVVSSLPAAASGDSTGDYPFVTATCQTTSLVSNGVQYCPNDNWVYKGRLYDQWGYNYRNCTSWVAYELSTINDYTMPNAIGDASAWGEYFASNGFPPNSIPAVGAIAWERGGDHVAYVIGVSGSSVTISEYNEHYYPGEPLDGSGLYDVRTVSASKFEYIHVSDLGASSVSHPAFARLSSGIGIYFHSFSPSISLISASAIVMRNRLTTLGATFQLSTEGNGIELQVPDASNWETLGATASAQGTVAFRPVLCGVAAPGLSSSSSATTSTCSTAVKSGASLPLDPFVSGSTKTTSPLEDASQPTESVILPNESGTFGSVKRLLVGASLVGNADILNAAASNSSVTLSLRSSAWEKLFASDNLREVAIDIDGKVDSIFTVRRSNDPSDARIVTSNSATAKDLAVVLSSGPLPVLMLAEQTAAFTSKWSGPDLSSETGAIPRGIQLNALDSVSEWTSTANKLIAILLGQGARDVIVSKLGNNEITAVILGPGFTSEGGGQLVGAFAGALGITSSDAISVSIFKFD